MLRTDPFSFTTQYEPKNELVQSVVVDQSSFEWKDQLWMAQRASFDPLKRPLAIYELQLKSWKKGYSTATSYKELSHELAAYCKKMHFTHVELYGLLDHMKPAERGYQITNYFAPYHALGSSDDLKYLIDHLHQEGIGVIVDWVMTHFDHARRSHKYSASMHHFDGTDLYAAERSPWGTLYLDYGKEETRRLMQASAQYFLETMHVDGLRLDAMSQMVFRDGAEIESGKNFLKELNTLVHDAFPGVLMIAEDTESYPDVTKQVDLGGLGFDLKWGIGWSIDTRDYFHASYQNRAEEKRYHKFTHFLKSTLSGDKQILSHSHDDSDSGLKDSDKTLYRFITPPNHEQGRFSDLRNFFSWQVLAPSRGYLIHMGDELGQPESWYQRFQKRVSSVNWSLEKSDLHQKLQKCVSDLNALYVNKPDLWEKGEAGFTMISEYAPNAVLAYHRESGKKTRLAVIHNFSDKGYSSYDIPLPSPREDPMLSQIKKITEIFNSDRLQYGGSGKFENPHVEIVRAPKSAVPTHFRISLPPLSTVVLEEEI
jgi:1,4-alpha-glucan branching enzyme